MARTTRERKEARIYDDRERKFEGLVAQNLPTRGRIFFVSSTLGSDNNLGDSPFNAFATVGKALSAVSYAEDNASQFQKDTTIFLLPGHAENISDASTVSSNTVTGLYMDAAGTKIVGLGEGVQRPKLTFDTATDASAIIAAADCSIENVVLEQKFDALVTAVSITAAGDRATLKDINLIVHADVTNTAATVDWFTVAAGADDVTFDGITANYTETGTDSIVTSAANRGLRFINSDIDVTFDSGTGALDATGVLTDSEFLNNRIRSGALAFSLAAGTSLYTDFGTPDGNAWNYLTVSADLATSSGEETVAAHEIATVSNQVKFAVLPEVTETVTSGGSATISLGTASDVATMIASTDATTLAAGDYWTGTTVSSGVSTSVPTFYVNGVDIGYTIGTAATTDGTVVFHMWWLPTGFDGGSVAAGDPTNSFA